MALYILVKSVDNTYGNKHNNLRSMSTPSGSEHKASEPRPDLRRFAIPAAAVRVQWTGGCD